MADRAKVLLLLEENLEEIRYLGKQWDIPSQEIDKCFLKALNEADLRSNSNEKSAKSCSTCRRCLKISTVALSLLCLLLYVCFVFDPVSKHTSRLLAHYNHPVFRLIRLAGLPIAKTFPQITKFYDEECLIFNPVFKEESPKCGPCSKIERVKIEKKVDHLPETVEGLAQPFVLEDGIRRFVSFDDLKNLYTTNSQQLDLGTSLFRTNNGSITFLEDLFTKETTQSLLLQPAIHVSWITRRVNGARVLRKIFPRPDFVPEETEVAIEKAIFIDGPTSQPYSISEGIFTNIWYVQAFGSRKFVLVPSGQCVLECQVLRVTLHPKDILFYSDQIWRVDSLPNPDYDDISVAFRGSFY